MSVRRILVVACALALAASSFSQGAFSIRRPTNGSIVRETVKVRIPRNSIQEGSYVGIWINGEFVEAVVPNPDDKVVDGLWIYELDTKAHEIQDGNLKIEAVLYSPFGSGVRAVNRSSVSVKLDNRTSLKAPSGGFKLRYNFVPGQELIYGVKRRIGQSMLSEAQAKLGGRAAELSADVDNLRYLIGFDERRNGGSTGLVRFQAQPENGKDYVFVKAAGQTTRTRYDKTTLHPIYMELTNTGREIFGRAPFFTEFDGSAGRTSIMDLYATLPLPILPQKGVTVGSTWNAAMALTSEVPVEKFHETYRMTNPSPGRGQVEAIEYQNGERTVRVRNKLALSSGAMGQENEEVYWFSLDRGVITRLERSFTTQVKISAQAAGSSGPTAQGNANGPAGRDGGPPIPGGPGGPGGREDQSITPGSPTAPTSLMQGKGGGAGRATGPGPGAGSGSGRGGSNRGGGGTRILRSRMQFIWTLEAITR